MPRSALLSSLVSVVALGCDGHAERPPTTGEGNWPGTAAGPAGVGPGVRVFSGPSAALSDGAACTEEHGATGDRWCGFFGLASNGVRSLFVVNVSEALAGVPVSCDAPDPNCLLLSEYVGGSGADSHRTYFVGDTLVYYNELFTPYVWRPGMAEGRVLVDSLDAYDVAYCSGAETGTAVACLALPYDQPSDGTVVLGELYAGDAAGESEPLLAPVDSVIAATTEDLGGVHRFSFGLPADGYVTWTSRATPDGPEILKLQRVGDPSSQVTIATDIHAWSVAGDGSEWLWLSGVDEHGRGALQTAPFPDGAYPEELLPAVYDYGIEDDGTVVALTGDAEVVSILDPAGAPDKQLVIDQGVQALVALSDQGHIAYAKHFVGTTVVDLFVSKLDGTGACALDTSVNVPVNSVHFSPAAGTALWARESTEGYDAFHSRLADCTTVSLATNVVVLGWLGPRTAIFMDDFDPATSSGSIRFRNVGKNGEVHPDPPTLIAEHADSRTTFGPLLLLYTVNGGLADDGVYLRAFAE